METIDELLVRIEEDREKLITQLKETTNDMWAIELKYYIQIFTFLMVYIKELKTGEEVSTKDILQELNSLEEREKEK